ncbi:MAG: C10 family peptidase [Burkholderiales bacterium]
MKTLPSFLRSAQLTMLSLVFALFSMVAAAAPIDEATALRVARNQITQHIVLHGDWGGASSAQIASVRPIEFEGAKIGYLVTVAPGGFLFIAQDDDLPPVPFYGPTGTFKPEDVAKPQSPESWIMPEVFGRQAATVRERVALEQTSGESSWTDLREDSDIGQAWRFLNVLPELFVPLQPSAYSNNALQKDSTNVVAKLSLAKFTTKWNQGNYEGPSYTYNKFTPKMSVDKEGKPDICERALTGCVATAVAQIMKYWNWPARGTGSSSITVNRTTQSLSHDVAFDWANMPDRLETNDPNGNTIVTASVNQIDAVATLMRHVGFAANMDYGCAAGSGANPQFIVDALSQKFGYTQGQNLERRSTTEAKFFSSIQAELDANPPRPVLMGIAHNPQPNEDPAGHQVVIKGYQVINGLRSLEISMGWGGADDRFYDVTANMVTQGGKLIFVPSNHDVYLGIQPKVCSFELASISFSAPAAGTTSSVNLTAGPSCAFAASSSVSWISVTPASGTGSRTLTFTVAPNTASTSRSGSISVGGKLFSISQAGTVACTYSLSSSSFSYTKWGGGSSISVSTAPSCNWSVAPSNAWVGADAWVTFTSPTSRTGSGTLTFNVAPNSFASSRTADLIINGQTVRLTQSATCSYTLSQKSQSITSTAQSGSIGLEAGSTCGWTATSSASWLTVSPSSGSGRATITYVAAANSSSTDRTATLTIGRELFTVTQKAAGTVSVGIANSGFEQGRSVWSEQSATGALIVSSLRDALSGGWHARLGGSNNANDVLFQTFTVPSAGATVNVNFWYKISTAEPASTGAVDTLKVELWNSSGTSRLAAFRTFSNLDFSSIWQKTPAFDLTPFKGQTVRLVLTASTDASNSTSFLLDDFATVMGGSSCTYSVTPATRSVTSGISSALFTVTTNPQFGCPWTATTTSSWLTVGSVSGDLGSGSFIVAVEENPSGAARTGTVTVAGQTVSINQAAPVITQAISNTAGVIQNPDFEQGPAFWTQTSSGGFDLIGADPLVPAKSGSSYARLGGYRNANDTLSQLVNIPANATGAVLNFWYRIRTDKTSNTAVDFATARIVDPETGNFEELDSVSNLNATNEWLKSPDYVATADQVAFFKGKTLRFEVTARTDSGAITAFYIDDIRAEFTLSNATAASSLLKRGGVDIDGDGRGEIVVRSLEGGLWAAKLNGQQVSWTQIADPGPNYAVMGAVDLDSKGRSDLIMLNTAQGDVGEARVWSAFNAGIPKVLRNVRTAWRVDAVGDLDGDGRGDIVWRFTGIGASPNDTGVSYIWFTDGNGVTQVRKRGGAPLSWTLLGATDLNGDGAADMIYVSPDLQIRALMATANRTCANLSGGALDAGYTAQALGSFSGTGKGEILARNSSGQVQLVQLDARGISLPPYTGAPDDPNASCTSSSITIPRTVTRLSQTMDSSWEFLSSADVNGDGINDIAWRRPSDGVITIWLMGAGGQVTSTVNGGTSPVSYVPIQR